MINLELPQNILCSTEDTKALTAVDWICFNALNNKYTIQNHNLHIHIHILPGLWCILKSGCRLSLSECLKHLEILKPEALFHKHDGIQCTSKALHQKYLTNGIKRGCWYICGKSDDKSY